ncbi:hydroxymethylglutaryl-CoA lyase [Vibrio aquaticus]|uniref:hydroxymethylglutaryl-CoA lyase n=1 Tax=Vibrio aquaticus TaxID=2496559 RepID=A0A432D0X1_9VIBR|nr:hydroxymethylglutaryl-CoA lyase [Vibrio aquaticus]RTZ17518.1 hydroxymethylglutaryl-CoA lyase [Vibrio aquaticus]
MSSYSSQATVNQLTNLLPSRANIVEVGPRDGLQNEPPIPLEDKIQLINQLSQTGLKHIESGAFVSAQKVPQMADSDKVLQQINRKAKVTYSALTPNQQGLEQAIAANANSVAIFTTVSETFCQRNINCSITESLSRYQIVIELAKQHHIPVRGYLSCVIDCPYEGKTASTRVAGLTKALLDMGCYEVSLGDTIGTGTPLSVARMLEAVMAKSPTGQIAVHFHDTYGQAIANIYQALLMGINTIDSSVAGLGGCPYAKGATGNVATEKVLYLCEGLGIETGVNLSAVKQVSTFAQSITAR